MVNFPIAAAFSALPMRECADAALQAAVDAGASHADVRVERLRGQDLSLRNARLERLHDTVTVGLAVRVVHDGTWGFASSPDVTVDEAVRLARQAVEVARTSRPLNAEPVELADEPVYPDVTYVSSYEVDPFGVEAPDKVALLADWSSRVLAADEVDHVGREPGTSASPAGSETRSTTKDASCCTARPSGPREPPAVEDPAQVPRAGLCCTATGFVSELAILSGRRSLTDKITIAPPSTWRVSDSRSTSGQDRPAPERRMPLDTGTER